jgi:hypothetical protein
LATWIALLMRWTCRNEKEGTDWKSPAQRLIEYYTMPSRHLGEGQR